MDRRWKVEFHEEFLPEFREFSEPVRRGVFELAEMLTKFGPLLGRPHVDALKGSRLPNMKELRFFADGGVWRVAFAFDLRRMAILLVGGDKAGISGAKFYRSLIRTAELRFERHQESLKK